VVAPPATIGAVRRSTIGAAERMALAGLPASQTVRSTSPPVSRQALAELLQADPCAHPWPYDSDGRWTPPDETLTERL
jgi:hypothetical protein